MLIMYDKLCKRMEIKSSDIVFKSFEKCGISNVMEYGILFNHNIGSNDEMSFF